MTEDPIISDSGNYSSFFFIMLNVFYKKITSTIVYCEHSIQIENNVQFCYMRWNFIELMLHVCKLVSTNFTQKDQSTCSMCTFTVLKVHYKAPITTDLGNASPYAVMLCPTLRPGLLEQVRPNDVWTCVACSYFIYRKLRLLVDLQIFSKLLEA